MSEKLALRYAAPKWSSWEMHIFILRYKSLWLIFVFGIHLLSQPITKSLCLNFRVFFL